MEFLLYIFCLYFVYKTFFSGLCIYIDFSNLICLNWIVLNGCILHWKSLICLKLSRNLHFVRLFNYIMWVVCCVFWQVDSIWINVELRTLHLIIVDLCGRLQYITFLLFICCCDYFMHRFVSFSFLFCFYFVECFVFNRWWGLEALPQRFDLVFIVKRFQKLCFSSRVEIAGES